MRQRVRKFIGTLLLVALVTIYALVAMVVGGVILPGTSKLAQIGYYIVAGFLWVLPAGVLIWWMQKPDPE